MGETKMTKWTKQYNNDTGPDDDYFEEWFEITDGKRIFRCEEREDADFLLSILSQQAEPVAMKFKIYKPTVPDPMRQDINDALLPWVYDQSRGSGFVASMWVTPVATLPPPRQPLTDEEMKAIWYAMQNIMGWYSFQEIARAIEAKLKEKNNV
jgi:hypothetical protein